MITRRGNKKNIARKIISMFPPHDIYIEPFFGSGSVFFMKPKAKYNLLNDASFDVYNFFRQVIDNKDELLYWLNNVCITRRQFVEWANGKRENSDVLNAVRFVVLSNCSLYGSKNTLHFAANSPIEQAILRIETLSEKLNGCLFDNSDFRDFFKRLGLDERDLKRAFCYADPPYVGTCLKYEDTKWGLDDLKDLMDILLDLGIKFGISEFDNYEVLAEASKRKLHVTYLKKRIPLGKKAAQEIYITNYELPLLF